MFFLGTVPLWLPCPIYNSTPEGFVWLRINEIFTTVPPEDFVWLRINEIFTTVPPEGFVWLRINEIFTTVPLKALSD